MSTFTQDEVLGLEQAWPMPGRPRPIVVVGAGGIVRDAHLPAYAKAGFEVAGLYDIDRGRAEALAARFGIARAYPDLDAALAERDAVFDLALPPEAVLETVGRLPERATVLIQKPLGRDLAEARRIVEVCQRRRLTAAVNFQLRFSPMVLAVRDAIAKGMLGEITDLDVRLTLRQPWELWPFMAKLEAVEVIMHSIHYLDWIRSVLGEPASVYARSVGHPDHPTLADARTSAILDYGDRVRCSLALNHTWKHGGPFQEAGVRIDGQRGAAYVKLGLLLSYPVGEPEELHLVTEGVGWTQVPLAGRWFPDAFVGVMANLQRFAAGEDDRLHTAVEDAARTMAVVDACWRSSRGGGTAVAAA